MRTSEGFLNPTLVPILKLFFFYDFLFVLGERDNLRHGSFN